MLLFLLSCSGKGDDSQKTADDSSDSRGPLADDTADSATHPCGVDIEPIRPVAGDDEAYYRADVEFLLSEPDPKAVVGLRTDPETKGKEGDPISGKQWKSVDEKIVYFTPDAPLALNSDYRSEIEWCGGRQTIPFHTSWLGTPVKAPKDLVGTVWTIDMRGGRWIEPRAAIDGQLINYLQSAFLVRSTSSATTGSRSRGRALSTTARRTCAPLRPISQRQTSPATPISPQVRTSSRS
jgi:hypothetical protein